MVLVMSWERQYFVCSLALFSGNAHSLGHVTDKLVSSFYLMVLARTTYALFQGICGIRPPIRNIFSILLMTHESMLKQYVVVRKCIVVCVSC